MTSYDPLNVTYMPHEEMLVNKASTRDGWMLRKRHETETSRNAGPGETSRVVYVVRMRHISGGQGDDWATFVRRERRRAELTQQQLADAVGTSRETVIRWEKGIHKPENLETVLKVAAALRADRDLALAAADLYAGEPPPLPELDPRLEGLDPNDPLVVHIMELEVDEEMRGYMLDRRRQQIAEQRERDLRELERERQFWTERRRGVA